MSAYVALFVGRVGGGGCGRRGLVVDAERLFFIDIGSTDGDSNWEHGYVHHDEVGHLNAWVKVREVDDCKPGGSCGGRLEPAIEEASADGKLGNDGVVELELIN